MTGNFILVVSALLVLLSVRVPPLIGGGSKSCAPSEGSASPVRGYDGGDVGPRRPLCQRAYRGGIADAAAFQPTVVTRTAAAAATAFRRNPTAIEASFFDRVARLPPSEPASSFALAAAKKAGDGSSSSSPSTASLSTSSKRKRKRKKNSPLEQPPVPQAAASASAVPPSVPDPFVIDNIKLERESLEGLEAEDALIDHDDEDDDVEDDSFDKDDVLLEMKKVAQFEFKPPTDDDDDDDDTGTGSTKRNVGTCRLGVACAAKIILLS
jgi:hypothetical protein